MTGGSEFVPCSSALVPLGVALTTVNSVTGSDVSFKHLNLRFNFLSIVPVKLHQFAFVSGNCQNCNNLLNVYLFNRPFRRVTDKGALLWDRIHRLEKGKIYQQVAGVDKDTSSGG